MMLCKCGGGIRQHALTGGREAWTCNACGRYEVFAPALAADAGPAPSAKPLVEMDMTREEANRLVELAQAGAPVHGDALLVALAATGDAAQPAWQDRMDAEELVQTLRREGLI